MFHLYRYPLLGISFKFYAIRCLKNVQKVIFLQSTYYSFRYSSINCINIILDSKKSVNACHKSASLMEIFHEYDSPANVRSDNRIGQGQVNKEDGMKFLNQCIVSLITRGMAHTICRCHEGRVHFCISPVLAP